MMRCLTGKMPIPRMRCQQEQCLSYLLKVDLLKQRKVAVVDFERANGQ